MDLQAFWNLVSAAVYYNINAAVLIWYKANIIILFSSKCNLLSPWSSWKIPYLALNNNQSIKQRQQTKAE
jgi:hypothetical protein